MRIKRESRDASEREQTSKPLADSGIAVLPPYSHPTVEPDRNRHDLSGSSGLGNQQSIQRSPASNGESQDIEAKEIQETALMGVRGHGGELPYLTQIQKSFGRHDLSNAKAYVGATARSAAEGINAEAYTVGNKVAFAARQPSLWTAAHEVAHIVQQQSGVQLKGGVGEVGDRYERNADAISNAVVRGQSAEPLLNSIVNTTRPSRTTSFQASRAPVQRLIGLEIEASTLPVTKYRKAKDPNTTRINSVTSFLTEGLEWAGVGAKNDHPTWYRETDHSSQLTDVVEEERKNWKQVAKKHKVSLEKTEKPNIIEYVTQPFDEKSENSYTGPTNRRIYGLKAMRTSLKAISKEIKNVKKADGITVKDTYEADNAKVQLGVPHQAYWETAEKYYGITKKDFAVKSRKKIMAVVKKDTQYLQATVGILPEKITKFLELAKKKKTVPAKTGSRTEKAPYGAQDTRLKGDIWKVRRGIMNKIDELGPQLVDVITKVDGPLPTTVKAEKDALDGFLRLVLNVTAGSVAWEAGLKRGGVPKNMVSFLPKTSLDLVAKALPESVRTDLLYTRDKTEFAKLANYVDQRHTLVCKHLRGITAGMTVDGNPVDITDQLIEGARVNNKGNLTTPLERKVWDYLCHVLAGVEDKFFLEQSADRPALQPEKPEKGGREGIAIDPKDAGKGKTRAIALETRHFTLHPSLSQLPHAAENIVKLVKAAHK